MAMYKGISFYNEKFFVIKANNSLYSESITRIMMTSPGERVGQPFFGVGLRNFIFDQVDDTTIEQLDSRIREQIASYEPRVNLDNLTITTQDNSMLIKLAFSPKGERVESPEILTFSLQLED